MKKVLKNVLTAAGGIAGIRVNSAISVPLIARGLTALGLASKLPGWAGTAIADLSAVGHVVAGLALGHKVGNVVTSKLG